MKETDSDRCNPDHYFERPAGSMVIPIERCVRDHVPTDKKLEKARELLEMALRGEHPKREPVSVRKLPDGRYLILDGNTTTTVLKSWGCVYLIAVESDGAA